MDGGKEEEAVVGEEDAGQSILTADDLLASIATLPGRGVVSQEAPSAFTCVQLGDKWQKARRLVVGACARVFQYDAKIAAGKHKLTAKLRTMGLIPGAGSGTEPEFGFYFPLSPSGYHITLRPPDPHKAQGMVGREVRFEQDKVFLQGANHGVPNMFDPGFYVATWVQLAVELQGWDEGVAAKLGPAKRAHVSLCCFGCRVNPQAGSSGGSGAGGGGAAKNTKKQKKKKKR